MIASCLTLPPPILYCPLVESPCFCLNGNFLRRFSANGSGGILSDPWGLTLAPASFGPFGNSLLVGNKGDGHISAFNLLTGPFQGQLLDVNGAPIANTGLWGLTIRQWRQRRESQYTLLRRGN